MSWDGVSDFRMDTRRSRLLAGSQRWLESERVDLRSRQRDPRDRVDPALRQILPGSLDLRNRYARSPEEVSEPVEALAENMPVVKPAAQGCEHDTVLGIDGIDGTGDPRDVEKP